MTRIILVPSDNGISIGTFIFDNEQSRFAYSNPITYDSVDEAVEDYHQALVNNGEVPFTLDEGISVWLLDLDSGLCWDFWRLYKLRQMHSDNAETADATSNRSNSKGFKLLQQSSTTYNNRNPHIGVQVPLSIMDPPNVLAVQDAPAKWYSKLLKLLFGV